MIKSEEVKVFMRGRGIVLFGVVFVSLVVREILVVKIFWVVWFVFVGEKYSKVVCFNNYYYGYVKKFIVLFVLCDDKRVNCIYNYV